jgi:hypothetical protein
VHLFSFHLTLNSAIPDENKKFEFNESHKLYSENILFNLFKQIFAKRDVNKVREELLVDESIQKRFIDEWVIKHAIYFKVIIVLLTFVIIIAESVNTLNQDLSKEDMQTRMIQAALNIVYFIFCICLLQYCPRMFSLLVAGIILLGWLTFSEFLSLHDEYEFDENFMVATWSFYFLTALFPNMWKPWWIAYALGNFTIYWKVSSKYANKPVHLFQVQIYWFLIYLFLCYTLNYRLRELHRTIIHNENLIKQNKQVVKTFPHGVLIENIHAFSQTKVLFTNKEFESKIRHIRRKIDELDNIEISFRDQNSTKHSISVSLFTYW